MSHYSDFGASRAASDYAGKAVCRSTRPGLYGRFFKRSFDVLAVLLMAVFAVPVILLFGLLIRLDGASVFYCQDRLGRNGRVFRIWKLRSMVVDADRRLEEYLAANPAARVEWDRTQKLRNDPRITPMGRLLRKSSLDELPQLWNVLKGDMSLVGPRPMMPDQARLYPGVAYYGLRPGVTGFWQISHRNGTTFAGRAAYDTRYAQRMSLGTDLRVLLATVWVVLIGTGC